MDFPECKRYNSFAGYYRRKYGERLQKLVIDAGFSCPNRDGTIGIGGCTYCDNAAFHPGYSTPDKPLYEQLEEGIEFQRIRYPRAKHYLAYFQAYSNTFGSLERLKQVYEAVLQHPSVVGIVIGTRPDCIDEEKLDYLAALSEGKVLRSWHRDLHTEPVNDGITASSNIQAETEKIDAVQEDRNVDSQTGGEGISSPLVVLEYGIESCYDETLRRINRGHGFTCARTAVEMTAERGLDTCAHFILGLPGETRGMLLDQCATISQLPLRSVKFHQLQIVKGTKMEKEYAAYPSDFLRLSLNDYLDLIVDILERLRPDLYIERVAGEVPPRFVNETPWGLIRNHEILHLLDQRLSGRGTFQGRLASNPTVLTATGPDHLTM